MDWEAGEAVPGRNADLGTPLAEAARAESDFILGESWYASEAEREKKGGGAR